METKFRETVTADLKEAVKKLISICTDGLSEPGVMGEIALGLQIIESLESEDITQEQLETGIQIMENAYTDISTGTNVQGFPTVEDPTPEIREVDANNASFSEPIDEASDEPQTIDLDNVDSNGFVKA